MTEQKRSWQRVTGLWENDKCVLSFKMTDKTRDEFSKVPMGTYLSVFPNDKKTEEKQPDAYLCYKVQG